MPPLTSKTETILRMWTVRDYHQMAAAGILQPEEAVELISGQVISTMTPQGAPHSSAIRRTRRLLEKALGEQGLVQTQLPIQLGDYSEPEPDIAVVRPEANDYAEHHPTAADIYLIIEVADSTLKTDRELKARDYARAGIGDYWVLDVNHRQLYLFRGPTSEGYQHEIVLLSRWL
ncbi:MAG: Uma2 family endonuclease [Oscillatoriales cyanobacterium RM2_1_1]|nr:Uma2 family endonuclease [Oscillatoriales cyanobacterium SM2_3_0]NJO47547.1 Uma2 family endonuclease [Oscillatoriales cyanobacterium RM2_1_1]